LGEFGQGNATGSHAAEVEAVLRTSPMTSRPLSVTKFVGYRMISDAVLEMAIADKLLATKDWSAIKGLINGHAVLPIGAGGDRPNLIVNIPQSGRAAFLEALQDL
jgi:hypothetical protein